MLIQSIENSKTKIILPRGDWGNDLQWLISEAGLTFRRGQKGLVGEIDELDLLVALLRPGDVLRWLATENAQAVFGATGTDCQQEFELETAQTGTSIRKAMLAGLTTVTLPQPYQQILMRKQPKVQFCSTPNSQVSNYQGILNQAGTIVTTFPQITRSWIENTVADSPVRILPMGGSLEGTPLLTQPDWRDTQLNPNDVITGVVDVTVSEASARDSGLMPLAALMAVELAGWLSEKATSTDRQRVLTFATILNETNYRAINAFNNTSNYRNGPARPASIVSSVKERFAIE